MTRAITTTLLLGSLAAFAERGLFTLSLQAGQVVDVSSLERAVPLQGTLEYGLSERWSLAGSLSGELSAGPAVVTLSLGPRLTLFRSTWWTLETLLAPEAAWTPVPGRFAWGARLGLSVRYLIMWGVGVLLEGGVRARVQAIDPLAPALQGFLVGGLFIEA